jgi:hypothetical protein
MGGMQWVLELVLVVLLAATLFHAVRLERALGVLKRDRSALEALVATFNASTRAAESGIDRLHVAAEGAGRQIARQAELAAALKDDLVFLTERGDRLADRLDTLVRTARPLAAEPTRVEPTATMDARLAEPDAPGGPRVRSQAERDLLRALRMAR